MNVTVPSNTTAYVYVPTLMAGSGNITITEGDITIWENGATADTAECVSYEKAEGDSVVFKVQSGKYAFTMAVNSGAKAKPMVSYSVPLNTDGVTIQAENYSAQSGILNAGTSISDLDPWDYVEYDHVNMDNVNNIQVSLRANYGSDAKAIDFRLDSPTGEIVSTLYIVGTNNSSATIYHTEATPCAKVSGTHKLYMTFRGSTDMCSIDWIKLVKSSTDSNIIGAEPVIVFAVKGSSPSLPTAVTVYLSDKTTEQRKVTWGEISTNNIGSVNVEGIIDTTDIKANLTVKVTDKPYITSISKIKHTVYAGDFALPLTVTAKYNNGAIREVLAAWDAVEQSTYGQTGSFTVYGTVDGTNIKAEAEVTVLNMGVPENVAVEQIVDTVELTWSWSGSTTGITYEIQRSTDNITWTTIGTGSYYHDMSAEWWFIDNTLAQNNTCYYRICALSSTGSKSEYVTKNIKYESKNWGSVVSTGKKITYSSIKTGDKTVSESYANDGIINIGNYWRSSDHNTADATEWITIDLGESMDISAVKLFAEGNNIGMPLRFKIEVSNDSNFTTASTVVADYTENDYTIPQHYRMQYFEAPSGTSGRYVRLYDTKLGCLYGSVYSLAFQEIQVCAKTANTDLLTNSAIESNVEIQSKWVPVNGKWLAVGTVTNDTIKYSPNNSSTKSVKIANGAMFQAITLEEHGEYTLTFDAYIDGSFTPANAVWGILNGKSTNGKDWVFGYNGVTDDSNFDITKTGQWQTVTMDFVWDKSGSDATVHFYFGGSNIVYIDNVSHLRTTMEEIIPLDDFKEKATIEKVSHADNVKFIISPKNSEVIPAFTLYTAVYNADNTLNKVLANRYTADEDGSVTLTLSQPAMLDGESYKLMIWSDNHEPLIQSISDITRYFKK